MLTDALKKVHFIGIGGISLSSLALYLNENGVSVSGSDRSFSDKLVELNEKGCRVWVGSCPENIKNPDLVVFSSAIPPCDEELSFCRGKNFPCMERNAFLGLLCDDFSYCIGVSGTHGKTTVTSMLIKIFHDANKKFFGHVGGETPDFGNCFFSGNDYFITEACEYKKSFLYLKPKIGIVLNAEADHPDTYENVEEIYDAFYLFLHNAKSNGGLAIVNGDSVFYEKRLRFDDVITFGISEKNRFRATDIYEYKQGYKEFLICDYGNPVGHIRLPIPGEHNVYNALSAFVCAYLAGIPAETVCAALNTFKGVKRRLEYVCKYLGCDVYCDYAHHPSEIKAALNTLSDMSSGKITAVFQPHTFSRTARLFDEFLRCFDRAERLIIVKEYPAREKPSDGKSASDLYKAVDFKEKYYCDNIIDAIVLLDKKILPDDVVVVLGAGDVVNICNIIKNDCRI